MISPSCDYHFICCFKRAIRFNAGFIIWMYPPLAVDNDQDSFIIDLYFYRAPASVLRIESHIIFSKHVDIILLPQNSLEAGRLSVVPVMVARDHI